MNESFDVYSEDFTDTVKFLHQYEQFYRFLEAVHQTRESFVRSLGESHPDSLPRVAGAVSGFTEILDLAGFEEMREKFRTLPAPTKENS